MRCWKAAAGGWPAGRAGGRRGARPDRRASDDLVRWGSLARAVARELGWEPCRLVVARTFGQRLLGMGAPVPRRAGAVPLVLAFPRCASVHTCFMAEPLDIAFADDAGRVIALHERVPPWRVVAEPGARIVLERASDASAPVGLARSEGPSAASRSRHPKYA